MAKMTIRNSLVTALQNAAVIKEAERIVADQLWNRNQRSEDCLTASDIAEHIGIDTKDLNSFLCDIGIQKWAGGQYHLMPKYKNKGLTEDRLFIYYSRDGKQRQRTFMVWTPEGAEFIIDMMKSRIL